MFQLSEEKSELENRLKSTTLENVELNSEMQRVEVEMTSVRTRLLSTLNELDVVKEKQAEDDRKMGLLRQKFAAMEQSLMEQEEKY